MATEMDPEKQGVLPNTQPDQDSAADASDGRDSASSGDPSDARVGAIRESNGVLRFLASIEKRIDGATKFEAMGVERVPESKRQPPQRLNVDLPPLPGSGRVRVVSGSMFVEMALTLDR